MGISPYRDFHGPGNLAHAKQHLQNPNLYSQQFIDPIYYPLEMPVNAEPMSLPKIELRRNFNENIRRSFFGYKFFKTSYSLDSRNLNK